MTQNIETTNATPNQRDTAVDPRAGRSLLQGDTGRGSRFAGGIAGDGNVSANLRNDWPIPQRVLHWVLEIKENNRRVTDANLADGS